LIEVMIASGSLAEPLADPSDRDGAHLLCSTCAF